MTLTLFADINPVDQAGRFKNRRKITSLANCNEFLQQEYS